MDSVNPNLILNVAKERQQAIKREVAHMRLCRQAETGRHDRNPGLIARLAAALSNISRRNDTTVSSPNIRSQAA